MRYEGLAERARLLMRIVDRGVGENLPMFGAVAVDLLTALPLIAIGLAQHLLRTPTATCRSGNFLGDDFEIRDVREPPRRALACRPLALKPAWR